MDKRKTGIFLLIFLLGLIAGFLLSSAVRGHAAADTSGSRISGRDHDLVASCTVLKMLHHYGSVIRQSFCGLNLTCYKSGRMDRRRLV